MLIQIRDPLPVRPRPCGHEAHDLLVKSWQVDAGRCPGEKPGAAGLCLVEEPARGYASLPLTLECWVTWPAGLAPLREPSVIAESAADGWSWRLCFDHAGALALHWTTADNIESVATDILIDALRADTWYHVTLAVTGSGHVGLAVTPEGESLARLSRGFQKLEIPQAPDRASGQKAALSIGRRIADPSPSPIHIGSAALYPAVRGPADFPSLGGAAPTGGVRIDQDIEFGNLGRVFAIADDLVTFSAGRKESTWFAFRVLGARDRTLRFLHYPQSPMGLAAFVSEDGGRTWTHPNAGVRRTWGSAPFEGRLLFTHRFASDEALVAASPPVTVGMIDAWLDAAAQRLGGRVLQVGASRAGRPLRVLQVGNPDAPIVYLQAGQHSMMERLGFFMITAAFEAAAEDADLMAKTRWLILPVVNVDSYSVGPPDGNMNRFWGKAEAPPTIRCMMEFLAKESERTGALVMADWHAGTVFRGHFLLSETTRGRAWPKLNIHVRRESANPEFEECLRAEGIDYTVLNSFVRAPGVQGMFEDFVSKLPGVTAPLCVELSPLVADTPEGTVPVTINVLRADGVRWYRAIRRYVG